MATDAPCPLWVDPDTGQPADDPGGPLRVWRDPDMAATARQMSDLDLLFDAACRGGMLAPLADYLGERVPDLPPNDTLRAECEPWGRPVTLKVYRIRDGLSPDVWAELSGYTPFRFRRFTVPDFAAPFVAWLQEAEAEDWRFKREAK